MYRREKKPAEKRTLFVLFIIPFLILSAGCSPSWSPSDNEAVKLVEDHYLFFGNGEEIEANVAERGEYIKECDCIPIKFKIAFSSGRHNNKTLYFYKDESGNVAVRSFIGVNNF